LGDGDELGFDSLRWRRFFNSYPYADPDAIGNAICDPFSDSNAVWNPFCDAIALRYAISYALSDPFCDANPHPDARSSTDADGGRMPFWRLQISRGR
jgi:hypothetical protein